MSLRRRLEKLEGTAGDVDRAISRAALATLSDEDLDALEDVLEAERSWGEDLDARGRRALDAYSNALEAVSSEADEDLARLDTMLGERRES